MTTATTKKVLYFIAGTVPTVAEAIAIAWLNYKNVPQYQGGVRSILANPEYGASSDIEDCDFVADANGGANIPAAYSAKTVLTVPTDVLQPDAINIGPAALSFVHTSVSQMTAFIKNIDGTLTDVTRAAGMAWTSATPGTATIGAGTGVLTGVAAGTTVITATYTFTGGKTITATENVTCS